jgi:hypothetical protein
MENRFVKKESLLVKEESSAGKPESLLVTLENSSVTNES